MDNQVINIIFYQNIKNLISNVVTYYGVQDKGGDFYRQYSGKNIMGKKTIFKILKKGES